MIVELIEVGSLDPRVSVASNRPVPLVVGHDENNVWFIGRSKEVGEKKGENQ